MLIDDFWKKKLSLIPDSNFIVFPNISLGTQFRANNVKIRNKLHNIIYKQYSIPFFDTLRRLGNIGLRKVAKSRFCEYLYTNQGIGHGTANHSTSMIFSGFVHKTIRFEKIKKTSCITLHFCI